MVFIPVELNPIWSNSKYPVSKSRFTITLFKVPIPTVRFGLLFKVTLVLNFLTSPVIWLNSLWNRYSSLSLPPLIDLKNKRSNDGDKPVFKPIKSLLVLTTYKSDVGRLNGNDVGVVDTEICAAPPGIVKFIFWLL